MTKGRVRTLGWGLAIAIAALLTIVIFHTRSPEASSSANPSWVTPALAGSGAAPASASPHSVPTHDAAAPTPITFTMPGVPDGGHLAVAVIDRTTGGQVIQNGDERFHTASIVKVDILACLLWQDQRTGERMTAAQMSQATRMIEVSDNAAADALFALIGKQAGLAEANRALGLTHTTPGTTTVHPWGQTLTTARDQLRLLKVVSDPGGPLTAASKAYIQGLMKNVVSSQRWGIPAAATHGATVIVKNGWLAEQSDNWLWIVNSIGRIIEGGHEFLVVTLSDHGHSQDAGIAAVEHAATAAVAAIRTG
jgi:beta-lactamase class A